MKNKDLIAPTYEYILKKSLNVFMWYSTYIEKPIRYLYFVEELKNNRVNICVIDNMTVRYEMYIPELCDSFDCSKCGECLSSYEIDIRYFYDEEFKKKQVEKYKEIKKQEKKKNELYWFNRY